MKRRDILKAGVVFAASSPALAVAPQIAVEAEDPRSEVRKLSWRISELLDQIEDYERVVISARSTGPSAVYTLFTI